MKIKKTKNKKHAKNKGPIDKIKRQKRSRHKLDLK